MSITMKIPVAVLAGVRDGLFSLMGDASQGLDQALQGVGRERSPEWFHDDRRLMESVFTFLDVIGWSTDDDVEDIEIDLQAHGPLALKALRGYLVGAEYREQEAMQLNQQRIAQGLPVKARDTTTLTASQAFVAVLERQLKNLYG